MSRIKAFLRGKNRHLSQIVHRLSEISNLEMKGEMKRKSVIISDKVPNNCFLTRSGKVCLVDKYKSGEAIAIVRYCRSQKPCKWYPFDSNELNIFLCNKEFNVTASVRIYDLTTKLLYFPFRNSFLCMPLCHLL